MTTSYTAVNSVAMSVLPTTNGVRQQFFASTTNPGNATFAPDGLSAAPILGLGGQPLQSSEIVSGGIVTLVSFIGPLLNSGALCWILLSCEEGAQQVGTGTGSQQASTVGQVQTGALVTATAAGTANALTASVASTLTSLSNGQSFTIIAAATNSGPATLALTLGSTALGSLPIVKSNNQVLLPSDIPAAGYPIELNYSSTFDALVMQNPATGAVTASGTIGTISNAKMVVLTASASSTFTADQIVVGTALNGLQYLLTSFNQSVNLATTGAGGMDTGGAPESGFVALYAIYNPATKTASILATNATASIAPVIYAGTHMPTGYTASALISVWPTNSSSQFSMAAQVGRKVWSNQGVLNTSTQQSNPTPLSIAEAVPLNANTTFGTFSIGSPSVATNFLASVASTSVGVDGIGGTTIAGVSATAGQELDGVWGELPLLTPQTIFYTGAVGGGGDMVFGLDTGGYTF